jgi:shikimate kinase
MLFSIDALVRYEAEGRTIPEIVAAEGWPAFREREYEVLRKLARIEQGALIDTGGGVVVDLDEAGEEVYSARKVDLLRANGLVVYLRRDPSYLHSRVAADENRPVLSGTRSFEAIMKARDPWYRKAADLEIECADQEKSDISDRILSWFYESIGVD